MTGAAPSPVGGLLQRRLLIVTGKGGVGKTTLSAALGRIASRRGLETVVVETGDSDGVPELLAEPGAATPRGNGREPVEISPHLHALKIVPAESLTEYLELQLHVRSLVGLVVRNSGFRRLLDAAPGWRELITLGKLWHLESRLEAGVPRWDVIIVDAPATGHGLSLLSVPSVVIDTVRLGPLRRHTDRVHELIRDPERTLVLPVTLLEELAVKETLELVARVRDLGLATGPVIANGIEPALVVADLAGLLDTLEGLVGDGAIELPPGLPRPAALRRMVESSARRADRQRRFLDALRSEVGDPICVPYLTEPVEDARGIARIAEPLESALLARGLA